MNRMMNLRQRGRRVRHARRFSLSPAEIQKIQQQAELEKEEKSETVEIVEQVIEKNKTEIRKLSNYGLKLVEQVKSLESKNGELKVELTSLQIEKDCLENSLYDIKQEKNEQSFELENAKTELEQQKQAFSYLREDFRRMRRKLEICQKEKEDKDDLIRKLRERVRKRSCPPSPPREFFDNSSTVRSRSHSTESAIRTGRGVSPRRTSPSPLIKAVSRRKESVPKAEVKKIVDKARYRLERRLSKANNLFASQVQKRELQQIETRKELVEKQQKLEELEQVIKKNGKLMRWLNEEKNSKVLLDEIKSLRIAHKSIREWGIEEMNQIHSQFNNVCTMVERLLSLQKNYPYRYAEIQSRVIKDLGIIEFYEKGVYWPSKEGFVEGKMKDDEDNDWKSMYLVSSFKELEVYKSEKKVEKIMKGWNLQKEYFCRFWTCQKKKKEERSCFSIEFVRRNCRLGKNEKSCDGNPCEVFLFRILEKNQESDVEDEWKGFFSFLLPEKKNIV